MKSSTSDCENPPQQRVPLNEDIVSNIREQIERTDIGAYALISKINSPPDGLNAQIITAWLNRSVKSARKDLLDFALQRWKELPDSDLIELSPERVAELNREQARTRISPVKLLRGIRPSEHNGLCASIVKNWLSGSTLRVDRNLLEYVLTRWRSLPDFDDEWLEFTDGRREKLLSLYAIVQISWSRFFRERDDIPEGLSYNTFRTIISGDKKSIRKRHYRYLVQTMSDLATDAERGASHYPRFVRQRRNVGPRRVPKGHIPLTPEMSRALKVEHERTGISIRSFLLILPSPEHGIALQQSTLNHWIYGHRSTVPEALYDEVITAWRSLPDKNAFWES